MYLNPSPILLLPIQCCVLFYDVADWSRLILCCVVVILLLLYGVLQNINTSQDLAESPSRFSSFRSTDSAIISPTQKKQTTSALISHSGSRVQDAIPLDKTSLYIQRTILEHYVQCCEKSFTFLVQSYAVSFIDIISISVH